MGLKRVSLGLKSVYLGLKSVYSGSTSRPCPAHPNINRIYKLKINIFINIKYFHVPDTPTWNPGGISPLSPPKNPLPSAAPAADFLGNDVSIHSPNPFSRSGGSEWSPNPPPPPPPPHEDIGENSLGFGILQDLLGGENSRIFLPRSPPSSRPQPKGKMALARCGKWNLTPRFPGKLQIFGSFYFWCPPTPSNKEKFGGFGFFSSREILLCKTGGGSAVFGLENCDFFTPGEHPWVLEKRKIPQGFFRELWDGREKRSGGARPGTGVILNFF